MAPDGMSNFLMGIYRRLDREKLQFDFIVMGEKPDNYHEEIRSPGGRVYKIPRMAKQPLAYYRQIRDIVKKNQYEIVFRQTDTATVAVDLLAAKAGGAKMRIPHAHSTRAVHPVFHALLRPCLNRLATQRYACSQAAGEFMFGKAPYRVVYNGIDLEQYAFCESVRREKRKSLAIGDRLAFGHIGNFFSAKNHLFLLEIFAEIKRLRRDAVFYLIGDGEQRKAICDKIKCLGLENDVMLLGERSDVAELIQALDCMIFPSLYEGLPIAVIEAQDAGLPCLLSDTITDEVMLTDIVEKESLEQSAKLWAQRAVRLAEHYAGDGKRTGHPAELAKAGYDLSNLVDVYRRLGAEE